MKSLTVIGCGNVGRTLCRLWHTSGVFAIASLLNRSLSSARQAAEFIGAGTAVDSFEGLHPAEVYLIATGDDAIEACCEKLSATGLLKPDDLVFHCSGSLSSSILASAARCGAIVGSVHPIHSFAEPARSIVDFAGAYCGMEGEERGHSLLAEAFERIGGKVFTIEGEHKTIYHAANVMVSTYLVALLEVGIQCYVKSGLPRKQALEVMGPLVSGTVKNVLALDTSRALTGPIARGDGKAVQRQRDALDLWNKEIADLYKLLGRYTIDIAERQGSADPDALTLIADLLNRTKVFPV